MHINEERVHCEICKRPILDHEVDKKGGIVYCYGCNHYFPFGSKVKRTREEIIVPNGTDYIRLRILQDSLEIRIKWIKNYSLHRVLGGNDIGMWKFFSALAFFINRTEIVVNSDFLKIEHKPLDILPMTFYQSKIVTQLFVKPVLDHSLGDSLFGTHGLYATLATGEQVLLLYDLNKTTLLFIEQEIERVLKIEDIEM